MSDIDDLEKKLEAAERKRDGTSKRIETAIKDGDDGTSRAGAQAGIEFVAAIVVSTGVGIALDNWLEMSPLFLLIFFFLGLGTGFYNIYRITNNLGTAVGLSRKQKK